MAEVGTSDVLDKATQLVAESGEDFILVLDWKSSKGGNLDIRLGETSTLKLSAEVPAGQWERIIVSVQGDQRSVTQNGKKTTETVAHAAAPISLKGTGEKVQLANIFLSQLK